MATRVKMFDWSLDGTTWKKAYTDGTSQTVDLSKLPDVSIEYLTAYGLKQRLQDVHAGKNTMVEIKERTQRAIEALESGEVRLKSATTDPAVLAARLIELGQTLTDDLELATAKVQGIMDKAVAGDKKAISALRKIKQVCNKVDLDF